MERKSRLCLFLGFIAFAAHAEQSNYVSANASYNIFNSPSATTAGFTSNLPVTATNNHVKTQAGFGVGLGHRFSKHIRSDITFDYRPSIPFQLTDDGGETAKGHLNSANLMLNAYYDIDIHSSVIPYVGAGIGIAQNRTTSIFWPLAGQVEGSKTLYQFAWQIGAGASFPLSQNLSLDANYKLVSLGDFSNNGQFNTPGNQNTGTSGPASHWKTLYANQFQIGLRYAFG
ncbi:MAG: porin family protein [Proteobacteria bacterium]|nr:porin family protein [Pseudomonadota bacterium]